MIEMLLPSTTLRPTYGALVDIDFSSAPLGSQVIPDRGKLKMEWTRHQQSGANGADGVVDVPNGLGRGYLFNAKTYFTGDQIIPLSNTHWRLTARIVNIGGDAVFSTGNYPSWGGVLPGFSLTGGQYPERYWQLFQANKYGQYQRGLFDGRGVTGVIDTLVVTRTDNTVVHNERTGVSNTYAYFDTGGDSYTSIGAAHSYTSAFNGYLLSLIIEELP